MEGNEGRQRKGDDYRGSKRKEMKRRKGGETKGKYEKKGISTVRILVILWLYSAFPVILKSSR